MSFGLPVPYPAGYPISPFPAYIPNPHSGAFQNPNGLNLGLINVNPLVSFQVTKSEFDGQKLVKPFINLHVTPNKGILDTVGGLFYAKKNVLHKHLHLHRYPPHPPPFIDHSPEFIHPPFPHHIEGPPFIPHHNEGPLFLPEGPHPQPFPFPPVNPNLPSFHGPPSLPPNFFDSPAHLPIPNIAFRSNNVSNTNDVDFNRYYENYQTPAVKKNEPIVKDDYRFRYARKQEEIRNNERFVQVLPAPAPGKADGSEFVSFPSSRRKRDTDQIVPKQIEDVKDNDESSHSDSGNTEQTGRALNGIKVIYVNLFI